MKVSVFAGAWCAPLLLIASAAVAQEAPPAEAAPVAAVEGAEAAPAPAEPAVAADTLPPAAAAEPGCELHVWPSERFQSMTTGWLAYFGAAGGLADHALHARTDETNRSRMGSALDSAGQTAALAALDLPGLLQISGYRIVPHDEPIAARDARARARHADSASLCYAELIVTRVFYHKAAIYGRSLRVSFLFRDFGAEATPQWTHAGRGGNGLSIFPSENESEVEAANAELVRVFQADFEEYARNLVRARPRRRGRS